MLNEAIQELKPITKLALPLVVAFLGYQLMGLVDTFVSGQLGVKILAATSLANALFWVTTIFPMGLLMGLDPVIAQALGAQNPQKAWTACKDGFSLALLLSIFTSLILIYLSLTGWPWSPEGEVSDALFSYMSGRIDSVPLFLLHTCARCFLQAHERGGVILLGTGISNTLNLFFSVYLGGGDALLEQFGLPALGWLDTGYGAYGIGLASSIVLCGEVTLLVWQSVKIGRSTQAAEDVRALAQHPNESWVERWKALIKIGAPVGGSLLRS